MEAELRGTDLERGQGATNAKSTVLCSSRAPQPKPKRKGALLEGPRVKPRIDANWGDGLFDSRLFIGIHSRLSSPAVILRSLRWI
jgi:hypothetical protein